MFPRSDHRKIDPRASDYRILPLRRIRNSVRAVARLDDRDSVVSFRVTGNRAAHGRRPRQHPLTMATFLARPFGDSGWGSSHGGSLESAGLKPEVPALAAAARRGVGLRMSLGP